MLLRAVRAIERLLRQFSSAEQRDILRYCLNHIPAGSTHGSTRGSKAGSNHNEPVVQTTFEPMVQPHDEPQVQTQNEPVVQPRFEQDRVLYFFSEFWSSYPKKQGKQDALRIYRKLKPDQELQDRILHAVLEQKASEQWLEQNGRFIPLPKTWLNRGSWDDEPQVQTQNEPRFGRTSSRVFKRFIERVEPRVEP